MKDQSIDRGKNCGICADGQSHVRIGKENYYKSADGQLMPAKKDQAPPDLRYFPQAQK